MKKERLKQLISRPTKRIRLLGLLVVSIIGISFFTYYIAVVSPLTAKAFSGQGTGTVDDPYRISNCSQLQSITESPSSSYVLVNDIDCSDTSNWNSGQGFAPISNFSGVLDGRNYAIQDLSLTV